MLTTVFVYGTLMPNERNAHVAQQGGEFTAIKATLHGYKLFDIRPEGYPCLAKGSPTDLVCGYALTYTPSSWENALPFLDELEGIHETPPLYTRERVNITANEKTIEAWVYIFTNTQRFAETGVTHVISGDWTSVANRDARSQGNK